MNQKLDVIRPTDADGIRLAKTLLRSACFGAIAVVDPETSAPLASRVGVATDVDGSPILLISMLAAHTRALIADSRCSLLLGEPGKGDPLAHPRITLIGQAEKIERDSGDHERISRRYLAHNPKAQLYVGLGDFSFFRIRTERASLNGGFGKAYSLTANDILNTGPVVEALAPVERGSIEHMNDDHLDAIALYARHFGGNRTDAKWTISGLDADGMDLVAGDLKQRIFFPEPLTEAEQLRPVLVSMARTAREALAADTTN